MMIKRKEKNVEVGELLARVRESGEKCFAVPVLVYGKVHYLFFY